jgi:SAM-dependent methyltransferase
LPGPCPACGGPVHPWREVPAGEPADPRRFPLWRCERCGSALTGGEPPGPELYERGVYAHEPPRAASLVRAAQRATVGQAARLLRRAGVPQGGRVLDAGAGRGRLVGALRAAGFDASGIDPSGRGSGVEQTAIEQHRAEGLDAVVLWHVLEHLDDPLASLTRVRSWLRPGGVALVALPNLDSLQSHIAGEGWLHLDVPRHRVHLTPRGLEELLLRAGLEPGGTAHMVWEHNPAGMWMALLSRAGAQPGLLFHLLKRTARPRPRDLALLAAGVPAAPVALALEAGAAAAGRGGTLAQTARTR